MPGFPDKFMPFMNQPPGSLLSSNAVSSHGRAIHALRRFTQASLNKSQAGATGRSMRYEKAQSVLEGLDLGQAEEVLLGLAEVFLNPPGSALAAAGTRQETEAPHLAAQYRTLIEQIPAVVFLVYLDRGVGEAYINPQIETLLGFSREEWLEDPVRWYQRIHADDKSRWSAEAAEMFLSGRPLCAAGTCGTCSWRPKRRPASTISSNSCAPAGFRPLSNVPGPPGRALAG